MSAALETKKEAVLFAALQSANAAQLRQAFKRKLAAEQKRGDLTDEDYIYPEPGPIDDEDALEEARARWSRGEHREALHHLELALGRDFFGLGDLTPEHLK